MQAEINYLGMLNHQNLVKLIGYCLEDDHRMLVYEFMPRGSLENHLFRSECLPFSYLVDEILNHFLMNWLMQGVVYLTVSWKNVKRVKSRPKLYYFCETLITFDTLTFIKKKYNDIGQKSVSGEVVNTTSFKPIPKKYSFDSLPHFCHL